MSFFGKAKPKIDETVEVIAQCPYCKNTLDKFPTRKAKCSTCGKYYFVRTDPITRQKLILTDKQVEQNERDWTVHANAVEFEKNIRSFASSGGYDVDQQKNVIKNDKIKRSEGDLTWAVANRLIQEAIKKADYFFLSRIYWCMSMFLRGEGRDFISTMQLSQKMQLEYLERSGSDSTEILTVGESSCNACKELNGKMLSIKKAKELSLLPCKDCTTDSVKKAGGGLCRCMYLPHLS